MEEENASGVGVPLETQNQMVQGRIDADVEAAKALGKTPKEPDISNSKGEGATEAPGIDIKKAKI